VSVRSWLSSIGSWTNPFLALAGKISWRVWVGAGCLALAAFWLHDHDTRLRQNALLGRARLETAAQVATLKKQAAASEQAANVQNARAIANLEATRQQLARRDQELTAQLAALRNQEQSQAARVATLPTSQVVTRVAGQLGLEAPDFAGAGPAASPPNCTGVRSPDCDVAVAALDERRPGGKKTRRSQTAATEKAEGGAGLKPAPATPANMEVPALPLSASGARKVEVALVSLSACRAQSSLEEQQIANCRASAAVDAQTMARQADSIGKLNQAIEAGQQILERQHAQDQAELRAARGTFWSRLARTSKHVAIGVAVGVALGMAVR
jgi:hypothetical protein